MKNVTRIGDAGQNFSESTSGENKDSIQIGRSDAGSIIYEVKVYGEGDLYKLLERACEAEQEMARRYPAAKKETK